MGFRFRRSVKVLPGVRLNISPTGISTTVGVRGATVNFGAKGTTVTVGIPGTGVSYSERVSNDTKPGVSTAKELLVELVDPHSATLTGSSSPTAPGRDPLLSEVTSEGLDAFKDAIVAAAANREELAQVVIACRGQLARDKEELVTAENSVARVFKRRKIEELRVEVADRGTELAELEEQYANCDVSADFDLSEEARASWDELVKAFEEVSTCQRIWRATNITGGDSLLTRNTSTVKAGRREVQFAFGSHFDLVRTASRPLRLGTSTDVEMLLYPGFVLLRSPTDLALVDLYEVEVQFGYVPHSETGPLPSDADVMGRPWAHTKRDGSRDRRFNNYQNTIARYGELRFASKTGLNEQFQFSNHEKAASFAGAWLRHRARLRGETAPTARLTLKGVTIGTDKEAELLLRLVDVSSEAYVPPFAERQSDECRREDAELFGKHVLVGWEHVWENGQALQFTREKALEFMHALLKASASVFDSVVAFARSKSNFA